MLTLYHFPKLLEELRGPPIQLAMAYKRANIDTSEILSKFFDANFCLGNIYDIVEGNCVARLRSDHKVGKDFLIYSLARVKYNVSVFTEMETPLFRTALLEPVANKQWERDFRLRSYESIWSV